MFINKEFLRNLTLYVVTMEIFIQLRTGRGWRGGYFPERGSGDGNGEKLIPVPIPIPARGTNLIPVPVLVPNFPQCGAGISRPIAILRQKTRIFNKASLSIRLSPG